MKQGFCSKSIVHFQILKITKEGREKGGGETSISRGVIVQKLENNYSPEKCG